MPLLEIHTQSECRWGLWRIDETWLELLDGLERRDAYQPFLESVRAEGRRTEWLAVRALLRAILGYEPTVNYRPEGYPEVDGWHVSFSHTRHYAAAICSRDTVVGIDIERFRPRIVGLRDRFLDGDELALIGGPNTDDVRRLTVCWSAKEAAFKMLRLGSSDWLRGVRVVAYEPASNQLIVHETLTPNTYTFKIDFSLTSDYVLTWGRRG